MFVEQLLDQNMRLQEEAEVGEGELMIILHIMVTLGILATLVIRLLYLLAKLVLALVLRMVKLTIIQ